MRCHPARDLRHRALLLTTVAALSAGPAGVAAAAENAASDSSTIEELVVTARKRAESLQEVPQSVSAYTGEALADAGYTDIAKISRVAPNVYFEAPDRSRPLIYVRGIGTRSYDGGSDPSVGTFIDGVYQGRFGGLLVELQDVARIEVLKGPQGTLYGRNTIGGAISIITRDPTDTFEGRFEAGIGASKVSGDNLYNLSGSVSGSLVPEKLQGLLSVAYNYRDGYQPTRSLAGVNTGVRGGSEDSISLRGKLNWAPAEDLQIKLAADYTHMDGPPLILVTEPLAQGLGPGALAPGFTVPPVTDDVLRPYSDVTNIFLKKKMYGASVTADYTVGEVTLTSITAARKLKIDEINDIDGSSLPFYTNPVTDDAEQFSQEFRASYEGEKASWLIGAYYGREIDDRRDNLVFGPAALLRVLGGGPTTWTFHVKAVSESVALFGQFTWNFTDKFAATLGARYSEDRKDVLYDSQNTAPVKIGVVPFLLEVPRKWDSFDPSLSLSYKFTPDIMAYATYASGYKVGAFQFFATTALAAEQVADPEDAKSYEIGIKSTLFDRRLRLNAAAFRIDYKDLQLLRLVPAPPPVASLIVVGNAADSKIEGLELEGRAIVNDMLSFDFSYAYLDARFKDYVFRPGLDFTGNRMPRAPKSSYSVAAVLEKDIGPGRASARLSYAWRSKIFFETDNNTVDPNSTDNALGLFDASANYVVGNWTVGVWGRNLTDQRYRRQALNSTGNAQRNIWAEPRTFGAKVAYDF
ncbi:TonB-dependent receptor [Phenylobacterium sp.]|uniref:TonB-dependent receptor n=1 Tax=Phenylobacterium sp. TaxID=1871053 RepID=UPI00301E23A3